MTKHVNTDNDTIDQKACGSVMAARAGATGAAGQLTDGTVSPVRGTVFTTGWPAHVSLLTAIRAGQRKEAP